MNNYEKIKAMTLDEMAEWYKEHVPCGNCDLYDYCIESKHTECAKVIKQWLHRKARGRMNDRFKFRAIVKGYYYIDTPEKCEEFEPLIFLENVDVLDIGDIGLSEEDLEITIRKQYSELSDIYIERILENFRDNSNGIDTYITITPKRVYQSTGLKDKNGKLIYEGDIVNQIYEDGTIYKCEVVYNNCSFQLKHIEDKNKNYINTPMYCYAINYLGHYTEKRLEVIGNIYQDSHLLEN